MTSQPVPRGNVRPRAIGHPSEAGGSDRPPERSFDHATFYQMVESMCLAINEAADYLSALDQAIGDGDHGSNMRRGFSAVHRNIGDISTMEFSEACSLIGSTLLMNVGGASGPLYGSLFMAFGNASARFTATPDPARPFPMRPFPGTTGAIAIMMRSGVEAVMARGRSDIGAKTMLDVLVPLMLALESDTLHSLENICLLVNTAADDTRNIVATKGRAAYLGVRSLGHIDPGAASAAIIVTAICQTFMEKT